VIADTDHSVSIWQDKLVAIMHSERFTLAKHVNTKTKCFASKNDKIILYVNTALATFNRYEAGKPMYSVAKTPEGSPL